MARGRFASHHATLRGDDRSRHQRACPRAETVILPDGQNTRHPNFARFRVRRRSRGAPSPPKPRAPKIEFCQQSRHATRCPVPSCKNISLPFGLPAAHLAPSTPPRGVARSSRTRSWMRWPRLMSLAKDIGVDGQAVWFRSPDAGIKLAQNDCAAMVAKKPGTPGRARSSRNTIAQGMPE